MAFVTVFCPLATTGAGETLAQTGGDTKFVVDCKVKLVALVGHVKTTLAPENVMVKSPAGTVPLMVMLSSANLPPVM